MVRVLVLAGALAAVAAGQEGAGRRDGQGGQGNGTFFQPFINGINTFFNPSQFRNPLGTFRPTQPPAQQQFQPARPQFQPQPQQAFQPQPQQQQFQPQPQQQQFQPQPQQQQFQPQQQQQQQQQFNFQQDFRQQQAGFQQPQAQPSFPSFPPNGGSPGLQPAGDLPETFRGQLEGQQDFRITRFPQQTPEPRPQQQFQPEPRPQQQFQPEPRPQQQFRFVPGNQQAIRGQQASRFQPTQRPVATDSVPTVPAVTSFEKFRPSEATATGFRFSPGARRPETSGFGGTGPDGSIFPPRLPVEQTTFSNSRLPTGPRGPFPDPSTAPSVEPVSVQGILSRPAAPLAAEPTAGRRRVRPRPTGSRTRGRGSEPEAKTEQPPTGGRGRVRSRFTGTTQRTVVATGGRLRVPTGTRIVPTGKRRRQKVKAEEEAEESFGKIKTDLEDTIKDGEDAIEAYEKEKADREDEAVEAAKERATEKEGLDATMTEIKSLKPGCNYILLNVEVRTKKRQVEIDGLKKAKSILQGAGAAFLQRDAVDC